LFLGFLGSVAFLYAVIVTYHLSVPRSAAGASPRWMEKCRELCLSYGLIPTGNIAMDAGAYLAVAKPQDLSGPLSKILDDSEFVRAEAESHPFIGQVPPDFTLPNSKGEQVSLHDLTARGPVVLVFYYGYNCSHCVAQLFGLQKDLSYLRELGAQVVALSADSPEKTAESFAKYGGFDFPVLADAENRIAAQYQVFTPAHADEEEDLKHGTFIIDKTGKVIFTNRGYQPFIDNKSILFWLADKPGWTKPPKNENASAD
jgi:peroxiredoxin